MKHCSHQIHLSQQRREPAMRAQGREQERPFDPVHPAARSSVDDLGVADTLGPVMPHDLDAKLGQIGHLRVRGTVQLGHLRVKVRAVAARDLGKWS